MKNNFGKTMAFLFAAVLAGTALSITGCKTVTSTSVDANGATNTVSSYAPDVFAMQTAAESAAFLGTEIYLNGLGTTVPAHPQDRPAFLLARNSLSALIAAGNFSAGDLTAALQALPIQQLQGSQGTLIMGEAVMLWDQYGKQLATLDKNQVFAGYVLPVAQSILNGLNMALASPASAPVVAPAK